LEPDRASEIADEFDRGSVAVALPFLLEAGYTARSGEEHASMFEELLAFPYLEIDDVVERRALDAQGQLARAGHHRIATADLMLAAVADRHGAGILHYDADYDVIRERTDLRFESIWLAERGSL
jgi:predicted nucleic acid-binding protein